MKMNLKTTYKSIITTLIILTCLLFNVQIANAYNLNNMTEDSKIMSALNVESESSLNALADEICRV